MKTSRLRPLLLATPLLAVSALPAAAQREGYSYISYVGQEVALVSKADEDQTARINTPVTSGDQISTGNSSRAEVVLASGNIVRIDARTDVRFDRLAHTWQAEDDRDLLYVSRGNVSVEVRDAEPEDKAMRIDTDDATLVVTGLGLVRLDAGRRGTEIYVVSGRAEVNARSDRTLLREGEYAYVSGTEPIEVDRADVPGDSFTRFVDERRDQGERPQDRDNGARYVSADYDYEYDQADLEDNGTWFYAPTWGRYCWRPTVAPDWRPYTLGYWRWTPCGLTWVSYEPWGWLPYHYGTWAFDVSFGWCWLPGAFYSPAWVYWNYTPGWVGWCPIGYYGFFGAYYRSARLWYGGGFHYPYLRGRVQVAGIDPRGWSYAAVSRVGTRLQPGRDILPGERVAFRPGQTGLIATSPLKITRPVGAPVSTAVQDAVRRLPAAEPTGSRGGPAGAPINEGLASILHRDQTLGSAAQSELRQAFVRREDSLYQPQTPESLLARGGPADWRGGPQRESVSRPEGAPAGESAPREGWRQAGAPRPTAGQPVREDGWRSQSSPPPRHIEPRPEDRVIRRNDSGWRAPARAQEEPRPAPRPADSPRHQYRSPSSYGRSSAPALAPRTPSSGRRFSAHSAARPRRG